MIEPACGPLGFYDASRNPDRSQMIQMRIRAINEDLEQNGGQ
ncbi:hypothetical protein X758_32940 [Mesorhizobium sp. LSHC416B00]|nr:hypothetical protein X761_31560 [Mesorhizobium sp. LSHC424B00]ESX63797.1 hypothetical protein X758_32940 [Mesorhizobium sp. LSHC416B00]